MERIRRGYALTLASWQVLRTDKQLIGFTALAAICTLIATVLFMVPTVVFGGTGGFLAREGDAFSMYGLILNPRWLLWVFSFYLVVSLITLFFSTALVGAVLERLHGRPTGLGTGFRIAWNNLPAIAGFALLSATIGVVLRLLTERFKIAGMLAAALAGTAWSIATFLVLPVIIVEGHNPVTAVRRSATLMRRTWGEQLVGTAGMSAMFALLMLPLAALVLATPLAAQIWVQGHIAELRMYAGETMLEMLWDQHWPMIIGIVVTVFAYIGVVGLIYQTLMEVFSAAVYVYATAGTVPPQFQPWMLKEAFKSKE